MKEPAVILKAKINPKVANYWLMSTVLVMTLTVVGIPLLLIVYPLTRYLIHRHLKHVECILTERSVIIRKGIFTKTEKTVLLDKITDVSLTQGILMRHWKLHKIAIETAGGNQMGEAFLNVTGIEDTLAFRSAIFEQKEKMQCRDSDSPKDTATKPTVDASVTELLQELLKSVRHIEAKLDSDKKSE